MSDIKPCVECDNEDLKVTQNNFEDNVVEYVIECEECGQRVSTYTTEENVIEDWNEENLF